MSEQTPNEQMDDAKRWTDGDLVEEKSAPKRKKADAGWERDLVIKLAGNAVREQRRARRWGIFFKSLAFLYFGVVIFMAFRSEWIPDIETSQRHTAVVDVIGVISSTSESNAADIVSGLNAAFEDENTAGIILRVNSPGGSPVQSGVVYDEIKRLRGLHPETPVYAVVQDVCASGGYYIATAADKIYADKASIVGSIGVRMDGFGFVDTMEKLGVERRLITAGKNKALLDPFSPMQPEQTAHMKSLLLSIHQQFIDAVKAGRGDRLKPTEEMFSGLVWTGDQAVDNGLIDELANEAYVAREVIGEARLINFSREDTIAERLADRLGASFFERVQLAIFGPTIR